jgi:hypothetical protein
LLRRTRRASRSSAGLEAAEQVLRGGVTGAEDARQELGDGDVVRRHLRQAGVDLAGHGLASSLAERVLGPAHERRAVLAQVLQRAADVGTVATFDGRRLRFPDVRRGGREPLDDRGIGRRDGVQGPVVPAGTAQGGQRRRLVPSLVLAQTLDQVVAGGDEVRRRRRVQVPQQRLVQAGDGSRAGAARSPGRDQR